MYVDILILSHLASRPSHGYEIKKSVERILGGNIALNNNLLYPALRRFEEMGAVRREVEARGGRPNRHVYHLTEVGTEVLQGLLHDFSPDIARDETEFLVRVAFFDLLDPPARLEILAKRRVALSEHLAHLAAMRPESAAYSPYAVQVTDFLEQQIRLEVDWVDALTQREGGQL